MQQVGYSMEVRLRGHHYCECLRFQRFTIWRPHDHETGTFPHHHNITDQYMYDFFYWNGNMECAVAPSYGWIYV